MQNDQKTATRSPSDSIHQAPSSLFSSVSHQLLFSILAKIDLPTLIAATCVDRTFSIVAQTLIHHRTSWATMSGAHTTAKYDFTIAAKDAIRHTLLGRPNLGFLYTTRERIFESPESGDALAKSMPIDCTIIGAAVQQITTVSKTSSSSEYASDEVYDSGSSNAKHFSLSLASIGNNTKSIPFHIPKSKLHIIMGLSEKDNIEDYLPRQLPSRCSAIILMASISSSSYLKVLTRYFQEKYKNVTIAGGLTPSELVVIHGGQCFQYDSGVVGVALCCPMRGHLKSSGRSGKSSGGSNSSSSSSKHKDDGEKRYSIMDCQVSRACVPATEIFDIGTTSGDSIHTLKRRNGNSDSSDDGEHLRAVDTVDQSIREYDTKDSYPSSSKNKSRMYFCGLSNDISKGFRLCKIRGSLPDGSLVVDGETKKQTFLQIFALDSESSKNDLSDKLNILMLNTKGSNNIIKSDEEKNKTSSSLSSSSSSMTKKEVLGGLLFTCGGRGYKLYGEHSIEANMFQTIFPYIGLSGMYGLGEIGPCVRAGAVDENSTDVDTEIMGFTSVYVLFYASSFKTLNGNASNGLKWTPTTLLDYVVKARDRKELIDVTLEELFPNSAAALRALKKLKKEEALRREEEEEEDLRQQLQYYYEQQALLEQMSHC
jgi:hypothetical protein